MDKESWVPVSRELPKLKLREDMDMLQSEDVLVFDKWGRKWTARLERWTDEEELWWVQFGRDGYKFELDEISDWMSLPADPPSAK